MLMRLSLATNEKCFAKLHSIGQLTTLVSTHLVMLTPNRDYWTGALELKRASLTGVFSSELCYLGTLLLGERP